MLGVLYKKMHIGVIRPRIRVRNEISRFLSSGSTARSVLALLDPSPDSSSGGPPLLRAYLRSKRAIQEVYELDPPFLGPQPRILGRTIWAVTTHSVLSAVYSHKAAVTIMRLKSANILSSSQSSDWNWLSVTLQIGIYYFFNFILGGYGT